ncbi:MAG: DUF1273 family protein [Oscillospiraceae bacterium]|nr:DUF1273 family protein [Oscillospiraceae bacterium]
MEFEFDKAKTVCFTGHRPEKLPGGGADDALVTKVIKSMLCKHIIDSINEGYDCFITGMARGIDLWAGELVLSERQRFPSKDIKLFAAIPHVGHGAGLKGYEKWTYGNIMQKANGHIYLNERYTRSCMLERNEFMVNHSSRLIAAVDSYASGTGQTVRLAQKQGLDIKLIDLKYIRSVADAHEAEVSEILMLEYPF